MSILRKDVNKVLIKIKKGDEESKNVLFKKTYIIVAQESQDHIIVGFGYQVYRYYDVNGNNFRTDIYLAVATGWNPNDIGFVKINDDGWLDSGFAVDIY